MLRRLVPLVSAIMVFSLLVIACAQSATPATPTPAATAPPAVKTAAPTAAATAKPDKPQWQVKWDSTLAAAKKEGDVLVYANVSPELRNAIPSGFTQKYGIKLDFLTGSSGSALAAKLISEYGAGQYLADAMILGATTLVTDLKPKGMLQPVQPMLLLPEVTDPKVWRMERLPFIDKDTQAVAMIGSYARYVAVNSDLVKEGAIASFKDLLKPEWKGKIVLFDPTVAGSGNEFVGFTQSIWGTDAARDFLVQLAKQDVTVTRDYRLQVETVAKGKYAIALGYRQDSVAEFVALGAPIALVKTVEGGQFTSGAGGLGIPKNPPHPNATIVLVNWLLSQEGQTVFMKGFGQPTLRMDIPTQGFVDPSLLPGPGDKGTMQDEEYMLSKGKMLPISKEALGIK